MPDLTASEVTRQAAGLGSQGYIDGPNRAQRRGLYRDLRAYRVRAARARDKACSKRGIGTPPLSIETSLRLAEGKYQDGDRGGVLL
jgi:hypothetical protein